MKITLSLFSIFIFSIFYSQNSEVKKLIRIDKEYDSLLIDYQKKAKDSLSKLSKNERKKIMTNFESKKNKERQEKLLNQLEKIKKYEQENAIVSYAPIKCSDNTFEMPNIMQKKSNYKPTFLEDDNLKKTYKTKEDFIKSNVTFLVTPEGYIENVAAIGDNQEFNKELEITLYKLAKWRPYCENGFARARRFRLPVTLNLKN